MFNIHLLPASFGDSILLEYGDQNVKYILIDGGPYFNFQELVNGLFRVAPKLKEIELLVVTHIDIDHIDGIITLLNQHNLPFEIKEIWFNGYHQLEMVKDDLLGALQAEYLSTLIERRRLPHNKTHFKGGPIMVEDFENPPRITLGDMVLTLLSPGADALRRLKPIWEKKVKELIDLKSIEERWKADKRYQKEIDDLLGSQSIEDMQTTNPKGDTSPPNQSSIAFIAEYKGKKCLLTGDATSDHLIRTIEPMIERSGNQDRLKVDAWKLAHHGSKGSTLDSLMKKILCKNILVSTDGKKYEHPHDICIAKVLKFNGPDLKLYFNYFTDFNKKWDSPDWKNQHQYEPFYPTGDSNGITVKLL